MVRLAIWVLAACVTVPGISSFGSSDAAFKNSQSGQTPPKQTVVPAPVDSAHLSRDLPRPTGPFAVGRYRYHWIDQTRPEVLASDAHAHRELNVDIWYPAQGSSSELAEYLPGAGKIKSVLGEQVFKDEFGDAAALVESNSIATHTLSEPSLSKVQSTYPVLIFSHGLGMQVKATRTT